MAAVQPPTTIHEWRGFVTLCERSLRTDWLPEKIALNWPDNVTEGAAWLPLADDHPFKGRAFCWRCLAEAGSVKQGDPNPPHKTSGFTICFEAARDEAAEHSEQDAGTTGTREAADLGFGPEFERPSHVTDTGTIFYERKA